jgi:hypothetical protein
VIGSSWIGELWLGGKVFVEILGMGYRAPSFTPGSSPTPLQVLGGLNLFKRDSRGV